LKNATFDELLTALQTVHNGNITSVRTSTSVTREDCPQYHYHRRQADRRDTVPSRAGSPQAYLPEYSNAEIADKLFFKRKHRRDPSQNLIAKLGVNIRVGLVKFALRNKLMTKILSNYQMH